MLLVSGPVKRLLGIVSILLVAGACAASAQAGSVRYLETPDHNIGCALFKGNSQAKPFLRCDIAQHTWVAPRKTKSCPFDYGNGAELRRRGAGHYECASDSLIGIGNVVAPGALVTKGRFTCTVTQIAPATNGVHCINRRNQHGFDVSPASITFF